MGSILGEDGDSNDTGDSAGSSSSGGCNSDVQETCGDDVTTKIEFFDNDSQVKHIFRDKKGHVADTVENREIILNTVNDGRNYMATDKFGVQLYSKILKDGRQVWAEVWNGKISNAGINSEPIDILKRSAGKFK